MTTPAQPKTAKPRGRQKGQKPREWDYTGLDAALLSAPREVTPELASMAAPTRARDERQVAVDKVVRALYAKYEADGKPDKWANLPKHYYHVDPRVADTVRMLVRRAASFYGYSARFGNAVRDQNGREIVVFAVRDQRVKPDKAKETWTLNDLRTFATDYFADDTEAMEDFLSALTGEDAEESGEAETAEATSE